MKNAHSAEAGGVFFASEASKHLQSLEIESGFIWHAESPSMSEEHVTNTPQFIAQKASKEFHSLSYSMSQIYQI